MDETQTANAMTMENQTTVQLSRDVEAIQIPFGSAVTLKKGDDVFITQTLGGAYTVQAAGGLYRIAGRDADALGIAIAGPAQASADGPVSEAQVWDILKSCYDPEIPVNIVDLGLVYDVNIEPRPEGGCRVSVKMTLTAPGCGMGTYIAADAQQRLAALDGVGEAAVDIVWDPPWHQSMITAEGRRALGLE